MWGTVFLLALAAATDPIRLGIAGVLIALPRPMINLLAFWLGGMATGVATALGALILLRESLPVIVQDVTSTVALFTSAPVEIVIGLLALSAAARIAVGSSARQPARIPIPDGDPAALATQPSAPTAFSRLTARAHHVLGDGRPWVAFVAGLGQATNPVEYLLALTAIVASGAALGTQITAAVMFTVVVLAVVEIPLVSFLATPAKTQAFILYLQDWLQARRRLIFAVILAASGVMLLARGFGSL
jgi:Sap-like sulfolipid-1-addressing protein